MESRDLQLKDIPQVKELFARSGLDYTFPDLGADALQHNFPVAKVILDGDKVVTAVLCRRTVEVYLFADPEWKSPGWRAAALDQIHGDVNDALAAQGIEDAHAWIPPQLCKSFVRRLKRRFGWWQSPWQNFCCTVRRNG
jgi:hypothetical protein